MARNEILGLNLNQQEVPQAEQPAKPEGSSIERHAERGAAVREKTVAGVKNAVKKFASLGPKAWSMLGRLAKGGAKAVDTGIGMGVAGVEAAGDATAKVASFVAEAPDRAMDGLADGLEAAGEWTKTKAVQGGALAKQGYQGAAALAERGLNAACEKGKQAKEVYERGVDSAKAFGSSVRESLKSGKRIALEQVRDLLSSKLESVNKKLEQLDSMDELSGELDFSA